MSRGVSTVNPGLTIPELIKIVKQSFRESEFDEVQGILMDREKKMKIEIENLRTDHDLAKKEARLLEKEIEVLKRQNVEAAKSMDELRREKVESDEKAEGYKIRIENLEPRIMRVEGALADMLNVKVEDLAPLANSMDKSDAAAEKGENVGINSDKVGQDLGNKNAIETEPQRCRRSDGKRWQCKRGALPDQKYCESHMHKRRRAKKLVLNTDTANNPPPHLDNGDRTLVDTSTKDDGTNTAQTSPGSQSGESRPRVEPVKVFRTEVGDLIEISDTDDETNCDDKFDSDTSFTNFSRRTGKKRIYISDEEDDNIRTDGMENQDPESTHDSEDDSSCSDGHMNSLVATLRSKKLGST